MEVTPVQPQLEICAETPQACLAAFEGGAHRIEICSALQTGGVTPSHGLIRAAIEAGHGLPVYVLLRPRPGDFVYSDAEFNIICADMEHAAALGASGFVTATMTPEFKVDQGRMRDLVRLAGNKEVTFHRAFDQTSNLSDALEQIIDVGCGRLLTSGGKPTASEGMNTIAKLSKQAANRIRIAAGGGITSEVAAAMRRVADVDLHVSLRRKHASDIHAADPLWDAAYQPSEISVSDIQRMAAVLQTIRPSASRR